MSLPENVDALLHPQFDEAAMTNAEKTGTFFAKGVNASPARQWARSTSMPIQPKRWQRKKNRTPSWCARSPSRMTCMA